MSQDSRENFGVKTLEQHWRVAGESGWGEREGKKRQKEYVESQIK